MNEQTSERQASAGQVERPVRPTLQSDEARRCADIVHWFLIGRYPANIGDGLYKDLLDLVRLTRSAERERCAKLCEQEHQESGEHPEMALHCAERIRGKKLPTAAGCRPRPRS